MQSWLTEKAWLDVGEMDSRAEIWEIQLQYKGGPKIIP